MERTEIKQRIRFVLKLAILIMVAGAWTAAFYPQEGALTAPGLGNLKYYTVLSNLLEGVAGLLFCIACFAKKLRAFAEVLQYVAAVAVFVTFFVVMVYLGPLIGYDKMFLGSNFFFHLVVPVAAVADFVLLNRRPMSRRQTLLCVLPTFLYGSVYLANLLINGVGEWPDTNDFYGFAALGIPLGVVFFAVLCTVTWGIAWGMKALNRRVCKV